MEKESMEKIVQHSKQKASVDSIEIVEVPNNEDLVSIVYDMD